MMQFEINSISLKIDFENIKDEIKIGNDITIPKDLCFIFELKFYNDFIIGEYGFEIYRIKYYLNIDF